MVLLVRFILVMIASRLRPRMDPLGESVVHFTVLPTDCDLNLHLNAGRFVSFMDVSRVELLGRMRLFRAVMGRGWRPVVGGVRIRYRRSLLPFQRFTIRSRIVGWDTKWFYFEHLIESRAGLCATGHARGLFRASGRSITPEEFLAVAGMSGATSPPLSDDVDRWRRAEEGS